MTDNSKINNTQHTLYYVIRALNRPSMYGRWDLEGEALSVFSKRNYPTYDSFADAVEDAVNLTRTWRENHYVYSLPYTTPLQTERLLYLGYAEYTPCKFVSVMG